MPDLTSVVWGTAHPRYFLAFVDKGGAVKGAFSTPTRVEEAVYIASGRIALAEYTVAGLEYAERDYAGLSKKRIRLENSSPPFHNMMRTAPWSYIAAGNTVYAVSDKWAQWRQSFEGQVSVSTDAEKNVYVGSNAGAMAVLRKFTPTGVQLWQREFFVPNLARVELVKSPVHAPRMVLHREFEYVSGFSTVKRTDIEVVACDVWGTPQYQHLIPIESTVTDDQAYGTTYSTTREYVSSFSYPDGVVGQIVRYRENPSSGPATEYALLYQHGEYVGELGRKVGEPARKFVFKSFANGQYMLLAGGQVTWARTEVFTPMPPDYAARFGELATSHVFCHLHGAGGSFPVYLGSVSAANRVGTMVRQTGRHRATITYSVDNAALVGMKKQTLVVIHGKSYDLGYLRVLEPRFLLSLSPSSIKSGGAMTIKMELDKAYTIPRTFTLNSPLFGGTPTTLTVPAGSTFGTLHLTKTASVAPTTYSITAREGAHPIYFCRVVVTP